MLTQSEGGAPPGPPGPARILVVDDEPSVREFVARALSHAGHDVATANDGLHALERLAEAPFDLLVTDIVMPGLDGIELALKLSRDRPELRILMMTGYAAERQRAYGLEQLIHRVIAKPFSLQTICQTVQEVLDGR